MKPEDFDQIIVESFAYQLKQDYFEAKRIAFVCLQLDFAEGLNESFQRFNIGIIQSPNSQGKFATSEGNTSILMNPQDGNLPVYKSLMERIEELPFPVKTIIDLPLEDEFVLEAEITLKLLNIVWPEIEKYMNSIITSSFPEKVIPGFRHQKSDIKIKDYPPNIRNILSLNQIALKYAWERNSINKENRDEIAKIFGHNSGHKLQQNYSKVLKKADRIADPDSTTKILQNKIELFESVIEILSEEYKKDAREELEILQTILKTDYLKKL
jgi:hypothetical protein